MHITSAGLSGIFDAFNMAFNQGFEGAESHYAEISMTTHSHSDTEKYGWMGLIPGMREWIGPRHVQNLSTHDYSIKNRKFEQTVGVSRQTIEDDSYGLYSPVFSQMGRASSEVRDQLVFELLATGNTQECYDGQNFFDTDHPVVFGDDGAVTQSNIQTGEADDAWFLLDTRHAMKPFVFQERLPFGMLVRKDREEDDNVFLNDEFLYGVRARGNAGYGLWQLAYMSQADLTPDNYEAARVAMRSRIGDHGRTLNITPNLLIVPPALEKKAMVLLNNERDEAGATNPWKGTARVIVTNWLNAYGLNPSPAAG